jgi:hypothetical protein
MGADLERVRQWARDKIQSGDEPPWAWYQYMKLIETCDAILAGMDATTTESSPRSALHRGGGLRLVDSTYQPNAVQHHPGDEPVLLPM